MDHAQDDDPGAGNAEDGAVTAVDQVAVGCAKDLVFGDAGAAFREPLQRGDLLFERQNEGFGIAGAKRAAPLTRARGPATFRRLGPHRR